MELRSSKDDENEKALEASVVENNQEDEDREVPGDTEKNQHEVAEISVGENQEGIQKFGEAFMVAKQEEKASEALIEENKMASKETESSGKKTPRATLAKTKTVKRRVKRFVKGKTIAGTPSVEGADVEDVAKQQGTDEHTNLDLTAVNNEGGEKGAETSPGGNDEEVKKVVEGSAGVSQPCAGDGKGAEPSIWGNVMDVVKVIESSAEAPQHSAEDENVAKAESFEKKTPKGLKAETKNLKTHLKRLQKGKNIKGTPPSQGVHKGGESMLHGTKEGMNLDTILTDNKMDKKGAEASPGGDEKELEKVIEDSVEAPENTKSAEKKPSKRLKAKTKIGKTLAIQIGKTKIDNDSPQVQENDQGKNKHSLAGSGEGNSVEKLNSPEVNTSEGGQQMSVVEKNKQDQSTQDKTDLTKDVKQKNKRQVKQVLGVNKKPKNESASTDSAQQGAEEIKEKPVVPEKKETTGNKKAKIGGLIFMCNAKTKPDCFRLHVMGVTEKRKDYVMGIKPGLKLFLYDYDLKLLYGIFQASSVGGMKLEREAFGGSFPAQVRFKVFKDCEPLPESIFRKAIKENYNRRNKFKTVLTPKQVFKLRKLFLPAAVPSTTQLTHTRPIPVARDPVEKRSEKDRYASGSSRTRDAHRLERAHDHRVSPSRREEPRDLYLTEREYRAYGLRRGQTSQHHPIQPPVDSYRTVDRDRVALDAYHPDLDRDRLLSLADVERHYHREAHHSDSLYLPERDYRTHAHRRELLAPLPQNLTNPPLTLDSYAGNPYYSYDYPAPAAERPSRVYPPSPGRDDSLYLRYATTADSLAEYYRTQRYLDMADPAPPPSSVPSRYPYSGLPSNPYR